MLNMRLFFLSFFLFKERERKQTCSGVLLITCTRARNLCIVETNIRMSGLVISSAYKHSRFDFIHIVIVTMRNAATATATMIMMMMMMRGRWRRRKL